MDLNNINIQGRLVRDPELKYVGNGTALLTMCIANNPYLPREGQENPATFINCECWGKLAEALSNKLYKGKPVIISGKLIMKSWFSDGINKTKHIISIESLYFNDSVKKEVDQVTGKDSRKEDDIPF